MIRPKKWCNENSALLRRVLGPRGAKVQKPDNCFLSDLSISWSDWKLSISRVNEISNELIAGWTAGQCCRAPYLTTCMWLSGSQTPSLKIPRTISHFIALYRTLSHLVFSPRPCSFPWLHNILSLHRLITSLPGIRISIYHLTPVSVNTGLVGRVWKACSSALCWQRGSRFPRIWDALLRSSELGKRVLLYITWSRERVRVRERGRVLLLYSPFKMPSILACSC